MRKGLACFTNFACFLSAQKKGAQSNFFSLVLQDKKHQKTVIIQILQKICEIMSLFQMKVQVFSGTCPIPMVSMQVGTVGLC